MKPFTDTDSAIRAVEQHTGSPETFLLPVADEMQDPMGVAMALITNAVLARGWDLDGFEQADGYRIYRYKTAE